MATDHDQEQRIFTPKHKAFATRALKNLRHLQRVAPDIVPEIEPKDLANAHRGIGEDISDKLKGVLNRAPFPQPLNKPIGPLFQNTLYFVQVNFTVTDNNGAVQYAVSISDAAMATMVNYATLAAYPIHDYAGLYGKNSIKVDQKVLKYNATVQWKGPYSQWGVFTAAMFQAWIDDIVTKNAIPKGACVVVPTYGVENTTAPYAVGYHLETKNGPYIWYRANDADAKITLPDAGNYYAFALSHEIAEMVVDPTGDPNNPEVCDPCTALCGNNFVYYFDLYGNYIQTVSFRGFEPPTPTFDYLFWISGIVSPDYAKPGHNTCPDDQNKGCDYPPPRLLQYRLALQHIPDPAWLAQLWISIHGPDPAPGQLARFAKEIESLARVRAIAALAHGTGDISLRTAILAALEPLAKRLSLELRGLPLGLNHFTEKPEGVA